MWKIYLFIIIIVLPIAAFAETKDLETVAQHTDTSVESAPDVKTDAPRPTLVLFWTSLGVTVAAITGLAIADGVAHKKGRFLRSEEATTIDEWLAVEESYNRAVITGRICTVTAISGLVATMAFGFVSLGNKLEKQALSLAPSISKDGGMLLLHGTF